jgi:two-component system, chemotaxis family, chemotaxis protein CheY
MNNLKILVIEDSEADQFLFKVIAEEDYPEINILQAYDGQQAQEMLVDENIDVDLIFLDLNMPRMNGYGFLDGNNTLLIERNIPVFILTSSNQESDIKKTMSYDCVKDFMEKTVKIEYLQKALSYLEKPTSN